MTSTIWTISTFLWYDGGPKPQDFDILPNLLLFWHGSFKMSEVLNACVAYNRAQPICFPLLQLFLFLISSLAISLLHRKKTFQCCRFHLFGYSPSLPRIWSDKIYATLCIHVFLWKKNFCRGGWKLRYNLINSQINIARFMQTQKVSIVGWQEKSPSKLKSTKSSLSEKSPLKIQIRQIQVKHISFLVRFRCGTAITIWICWVHWSVRTVKVESSFHLMLCLASTAEEVEMRRFLYIE